MSPEAAGQPPIPAHPSSVHFISDSDGKIEGCRFNAQCPLRERQNLIHFNGVRLGRDVDLVKDTSFFGYGVIQSEVVFGVVTRSIDRRE